jgi:CRISPR system Cascade subunit CasE
MYLSKVKIIDNRVRNPYELHRLIWTLFADRQPENRGFLFRVEKERRSNSIDVLLQSQWQPEKIESSNVRVLASRDYCPILQPNQALRFRLVSNPIKTIKDQYGRINSKGSAKACRVPLVQEEQQLAWLSRKFSGAALIEVASVNSRRPIYFRKDGKAGKIMAVTFDGMLRVENSEHFWTILQKGVGPAKSFGCGLLSIAKA